MKTRRSVVIILLAFSFLRAISPMNGERILSVLDFENRSGNNELNYLEQQIPQWIIDQRLRIPEYRFVREAILPTEADENIAAQTQVMTYSLLGKFNYDGISETIDLTIDLINTSNYRPIGTRQFKIPYENPGRSAGLIIENLADILRLKPLDASILEKTPQKTGLEIDESTIAAVKEELSELSHSLNVMGTDVDSSSQMSADEGHFDNIYYRKLHSTDARTDLDLAMTSQKTVQNALLNILRNPYGAEIGEPRITSFPYNPELLHIQFEIEYTLKKNVIHDIVEMVPFQQIQKDDGNYEFMTYRAKYSDIPFNLRQDIQHGNYRILPVIKMMDYHNLPRLVIFDEKYLDQTLPKKSRVTILTSNQFKQLMVLTSSNVDIQMYLKDEPFVGHYEIEMNLNDFNAIDHIAVEFIRIDEIEAFVNNL